MIVLILLIAAVAGCGDTSTGPAGEKTIDLTVYVTEEDGSPVHRAVVTTIPPTDEITTDERGGGTFTDIIEQPYFFVINPPGRPTYQYYLTLENANTDSLSLMIVTQPPKVDILFPMQGNIVSTEAAFFTGAAIDHEDGPVPDSLLVWSLDNTGIAGKGRDFSLSGLSPGPHTVMLTAYDSEGKASHSQIQVIAAPYPVTDYFPLVNGAEWLYSHSPAQFNMYNHHQIMERWALDNVIIEIDDAGRRISTMTYSATALSNVRYYRYQIIDEFQESGSGIVITRTTEEMRIWRNSTEGQPREYLHIETEYDPAIPILDDKNAPGEGGDRTYTGTAEASWTYINIEQGTTSFTENPAVSITVSAGVPETINLGGKTIETTSIVITEGASRRTWWLAPGFGIVRFQYNTFNANPVASLIGTNLATNNAYPLNLKTSMKQAPDVVTIGGIPETKLDHLRKARAVMRTAAP